MNEIIEPLTDEEVAEIERDYQEHGQYKPLTSQDKRFIQLLSLATKNGYERDQLRAENERLRGIVTRAKQWLHNGVEMGYLDIDKFGFDFLESILNDQDLTRFN